MTRKEKILNKIPKEYTGNRKKRSKLLNGNIDDNTSKVHLNGCPLSPQKTRLVADLIRGKKVGDAINILKMTTRASTPYLLKLIYSAINNFEQKSDGDLNTENLYVDTIMVDGGAALKRLRPAPQGRAYRVKKRSNHITLILASK